MDANTTPIQNVEILILKLKANNTKFAFPVIENLHGKKITGIEAFGITQFPTSPLGDNNCNANAFKQCFLTLSIDGKEKVKDLPIGSLVAANNNGLIKTFNDVVINEQKSYVQFSATTNLVDDEVIMIAFYYKDK